MSAAPAHDPDAPRRVVHAAWEVVADEGLVGATMRSIATRAGASTGLLTHHWVGKDDILAEVLPYNNALGVRRIAASVGDRRGLDALRATLTALLPFDEEGRRLWRVWVAAWTAPERHATFAASLEDGWAGLHGLLRTTLEQAVVDGEIGLLDLDRETDRLVAMLAGAGLATGARTSADVDERIVTMLFDHVEEVRSTHAPKTSPHDTLDDRESPDVAR